MDNPYKKQLEKLIGQKVTLNRADAPDVSGEVKLVTSEVVQLDLDLHENGADKQIIVSLDHIRGVSFFEWANNVD